jgi:predicted RNase H-like nuclease
MPSSVTGSDDLVVAIGVDGARAGWVGACLYAGGRTELRLFADVWELHAFRGGAAVAMDVPIGVLETVGFRPCDVEARKRLGARASCVFAPPARYMLPAAGDYAAIRRLVDQRRRAEPAAKSLSAQAAGIAPKVAEVDAFVRAHPEAEAWLWECHPELCFAALDGGGALAAPKRSAEGRARRLALVRERFPEAPQRLATAPWRASAATTTDALDAYAALTTALRCARGEHDELGGDERDDAGVLMRVAV